MNKTPNDILRLLQSSGYEASISKKSGLVIIVHTEHGSDRAGILRDEIAPLLGGEFVQGSRLKATAKSSKGGVVVGNVNVIAKDTVKGSALGSIDARVFTKKANRGKVTYGGYDVDVATFDSYKEIEESLIQGCLDTPALGESVADTFRDFFISDSLIWGEFQPVAILNKIGVYGGEVLLGWAALKAPSKYITGANPFRSKVVAFHIPTDPSFSGVDSFVEMDDGSLVGISSKFDGGAAASIFSNLLPIAVKHYKELEPSTLKELAKICKERSISNPGRMAKTIVWEWGVNVMLGLGIKNPEKLVDIVKANKQSPDLARLTGVVYDILAKKNDPRKNNLPHTLSNVFNQEIAARMMRDSYEQSLNFLSAKDYYQMTLNKNLWTKGTLQFKGTKAGSSKITIHGRKSPQHDITARQGWVNYEIKRG